MNIRKLISVLFIAQLGSSCAVERMDSESAKVDLGHARSIETVRQEYVEIFVDLGPKSGLGLVGTNEQIKVEAAKGYLVGGQRGQLTLNEVEGQLLNLNKVEGVPNTFSAMVPRAKAHLDLVVSNVLLSYAGESAWTEPGKNLNIGGLNIALVGNYVQVLSRTLIGKIELGADAGISQSIGTEDPAELCSDLAVEDSSKLVFSSKLGAKFSSESSLRVSINGQESVEAVGSVYSSEAGRFATWELSKSILEHGQNTILFKR